MELMLIDREYQNVGLIDVFESLIWTERYYGAGNFELYTPMNLELFREIKQDYMLYLKDSDQVMLIEETEISTDVETGAHLKISGRSLESILDRRIIWSQTVLNGNFQNAVKKLLAENVINPEIQERKIPNFVFVDSTDPKVTGLTISAQFTGDNLYDTLVTLCETYEIGFRVLLDDQNRLCFSLYAGVDRTYDQFENPYVIFSPKFENLVDSNFLESSKALKTVALVAGEDSAQNRRTRVVSTTNGTGLDRREMYVDARDIQSERSDGTVIPDAEYLASLDHRGEQKLAENIYVKVFEGGIETHNMFVYGKDFFKGDIVQIENEFEIASKVRILEIIRSEDETGYSVYPTFSVKE